MIDAPEHEIGRIEIGLVAQGRKAREAELVLDEQLSELERQVAALRQEGNAPAGQRIARELKARRRVEDTETVGSEQHRACSAHARDERRLATLPFLARLAETGADADDRGRPHREGIVDRGVDVRRGDGDGRQPHRAWHVACRGVGGLPQHRLGARVDQVDRSRSPECAQRKPVAPLGRVVSGTDDRDRDRVEQRRQITSGHAWTATAFTLRG